MITPPSKVLLQSWAESSEDSVSHSLMAAACGRCQAVSKTRLTITASGVGCPQANIVPCPFRKECIASIPFNVRYADVRFLNAPFSPRIRFRSEEHTSELQS